jgi:hypothetical protein
MTEIRDAVAEALYRSHCRPDDPTVWNRTAEWVRESWRRQADAAIAAHLDALKADGYALVKLADTQIDPEWGDEYWAVPTEDYKYPGKLRIETGYRDGVPRISHVSVPTPMRTTEVDAYVSALLAAKAAAEAQR